MSFLGHPRFLWRSEINDIHIALGRPIKRRNSNAGTCLKRAEELALDDSFWRSYLLRNNALRTYGDFVKKKYDRQNKNVYSFIL